MKTSETARIVKLLGKQVLVTLDEQHVAQGKLVGFGDGGEFEIADDDGCLHYCWPMLGITEAKPGE